jgi:2-polyprenyl-6-methoxyphenol hydroxylase-like FAD-dependent oxidoreductase
VRFATGAEARADALIGADGVVSRVRRQLTGKGPPDYPPYAGYTVWHAIVEDTSVPAGRFVLQFGRGSRFAYYRVDADRVYWSGIAYVPKGDEGTIDREAVLDLFAGYAGPAAALIAATDRMQRHDIFGGEPLGAWGSGRVTVLGDAAHPMTTNLGQGAGMAIEDGVVLGCSVADHADPVVALRDYEERRINRTTTMMRLANRLNSDAAHESRARVWLRDRLIGHGGFQRGFARRYEKFIEADPFE